MTCNCNHGFSNNAKLMITMVGFATFLIMIFMLVWYANEGYRNANFILPAYDQINGDIMYRVNDPHKS